MSSTPHPVALYRHFDGTGRLLYVGVSRSPLRRTGQHADAEWATEIHRVEFEFFPTLAEARKAETRAIVAERPAHNKHHVVVLSESTGSEYSADILAEIKAHCASSGLKPTVFGLRAVNDGKLVARLESGGECLPSTTRKIRSFIAARETAA